MFRTVLFVCTGNICRSPMAEGLFKKYAANQHFTMQISSAGLAAVVDKPATPFSQSLLWEKHQVDISAHRAKQLTPSMVSIAELILVMENHQKKQLEFLYPYAHGKVFLLGKWNNVEVPDPYGATRADYEHVLTLIDHGLADWQKKLCAS